MSYQLKVCEEITLQKTRTRNRKMLCLPEKADGKMDFRSNESNYLSLFSKTPFSRIYVIPLLNQYSLLSPKKKCGSFDYWLVITPACYIVHYQVHSYLCESIYIVGFCWRNKFWLICRSYVQIYLVQLDFAVSFIL